eukprot:5244255-Prymnesium_polylepis.1
MGLELREPATGETLTCGMLFGSRSLILSGRDFQIFRVRSVTSGELNLPLPPEKTVEARELPGSYTTRTHYHK